MRAQVQPGAGVAEKRAPTPLLAFLALGVVYGDIGTSPLYAIRECFSPEHGVAPTASNVVGVLSLITWSLVVVISVKYLGLILRADNGGEGGIIALMALVHPEHGGTGRLGRRASLLLVLFGLFGAALLYGDSMITPAISVMGALEGLSVGTEAFTPLVVPLTVVILVGLFLVQRRGTAGVGALFGPVAAVWFATLAVLGIWGIVHGPDVLRALNPVHAVRFFLDNGLAGFLVLGAVFLVVTGGEALYADLGHFGIRPIRLAWFVLVLPALLLNYYGQGALLLVDPTAVRNPFYLLAPGWFLYPLLVIATAATIIASQAVISGAYSLTMQAVNLGYAPRLRISHTSATERGQIYMPDVNAVLMVATVGLVLAFRSSSAIAGAYGVAVSLDMAITTLLFGAVARTLWNWSLWIVVPMVGVFLAIDLSFFAANVPKIPAGGWFPLVVAAVVFTLMTTWRRGRKLLGKVIAERPVPLAGFVDEMRASPVLRVPGTAVFPTGNPDVVPAALLRNLQHNKVVHENVLLLSVQMEETARVRGDRFEFADRGEGVKQIVARYGFMEEPRVPDIMLAAKARGFGYDPEDTTFFLGRERPIPTRMPSGMAFWRERLFAIMSRNAQSATAYFRIPPEQVVEVGAQVKLETPGAPRA